MDFDDNGRVLFGYYLLDMSRPALGRALLAKLPSSSVHGPVRGRVMPASRKPTSTSSRRYLTLSDAAGWLSLDEKTLRRWISQGRLTAYRVGPKLIRLDADEIESMIRVVPTAGATL